MNNTLTALNNYLFEELERLNDDSLSPEQLKQEIDRSRAVTQVSQQIVNNGKLALSAIRCAAAHAGGRNQCPESISRRYTPL